MGIFDRLFGRRKRVEELGQGTGTSPLKRELQRQRENTEKCVLILSQCLTPREVIEGFRQIALLLRQASDPLVDAAELTARKAKSLTDEYILRLRDDFIRECKAFLSATDQGLREL